MIHEATLAVAKMQTKSFKIAQNRAVQLIYEAMGMKDWEKRALPCLTKTGPLTVGHADRDESLYGRCFKGYSDVRRFCFEVQRRDWVGSSCEA